MRRRTGLVETHAYAVLEADEVPYLGCTTERLVKVRNPHGTGEWKRRWGDNSLCWSLHADASRLMKFESRDDGVFHMTLDDFADHFSDVSVCNLTAPSAAPGFSGTASLATFSAAFTLTQPVASFKLLVPVAPDGSSIVQVSTYLNVVDCDRTSKDGARDQLWAIKVFADGVEVGGSGETVFNECSAHELAWRNATALATPLIQLTPSRQYTLALYSDAGHPLNVVITSATVGDRPVEVVLG